MTPLAARHPVGEALHAEELHLALEPAERRFPARIGCTKLVTLTERMKLPPGSTVEGLPAAVELGGTGGFEGAWTVEGGELVIAEKIVLRARIIDPARWPEVRAALRAFRTYATTPLLLKPRNGGKEGA